jgi:tRNA 2-thiouridine synthesizing protein A
MEKREGRVEDSTLRVDHHLNLRGILCPINFVKAKLKLEEMEDGQNLEIVIDDGEPMQNVPRSIKEEGHKIIKVEKLSDGSFKLLVRKGGRT